MNLAHYVRIFLLLLIPFGAKVEQRLDLGCHVLHCLLCALLRFDLSTQALCHVSLVK